MPSPAGARHTLSKIPAKIQKVKIGGGGEIRTHERISPLAVFKTAALVRYATPPNYPIST